METSEAFSKNIFNNKEEDFDNVKQPFQKLQTFECCSAGKGGSHQKIKEELVVNSAKNINDILKTGGFSDYVEVYNELTKEI